MQTTAVEIRTVPDTPAYTRAAAQRHYRELLALLERRLT